MKRFMRGIATLALISSVVFLGGSSAGAQQSSCQSSITYTGPESNNTIVCGDTLNLNVVCNNNIYVLDTNSQTAVSGAAVAAGNTTGGTATSGNVSNSNGTNYQLGASCGTPATTVATTPTPTPESPKPAAPAAKPKPAALPNTASNPIVDVAIISTAALAVILVASRLGIIAYRHASLK